MEITQIANVGVDGLEQIFKHLSINDLLNVVDTNTQLRQAARFAFVGKFGGRVVHLCSRGTRKLQSFNIFDNFIWISDLLTCLKVIRNFGQSIPALNVCYYGVPEAHRTELDRYINKYCVESLVDLEYGGESLKNLTNPFPNVKTVAFFGNLQCDQLEIHRCFPNVETLKLTNSSSAQSINTHFPHLKHLQIHNERNSIKIDDLLGCLRSNAQLQSLRTFNIFFNPECLQATNECPQLKSLSVMMGSAFSNHFGEISVNSKNVTKFETDGSYLKQLHSSKVSLSFDQLEELIIHKPLSQTVLDFITKHQSVTKFTYYGWKKEDFNDEQPLLVLAQAFPSLTDVSFYLNTFLVDDAVEFVKECKSLQSFFIFSLDQKMEYKLMENCLGNAWRMTINNSIFGHRMKIQRIRKTQFN